MRQNCSKAKVEVVWPSSRAVPAERLAKDRGNALHVNPDWDRKRVVGTCGCPSGSPWDLCSYQPTWLCTCTLMFGRMLLCGARGDCWCLPQLLSLEPEAPQYLFSLDISSLRL